MRAFVITNAISWNAFSGRLENEQAEQLAGTAAAASSVAHKSRRGSYVCWRCSSRLPTEVGVIDHILYVHYGMRNYR